MKPAIIFSVLLAASQLARAQTPTPLVKDGEAVAFMGDSITQFGSVGPGGYVTLVESGLKVNGITIKVIPAGVSGDKSNQMLARLQKSVLARKPAWMTLSCGVNDVWHQENGKGILIDEYKKNITSIVDQADKAGIKVMILTATLITENLDNVSNGKAVEYNAFLRDLAKARHYPLADLNEDMRREWKQILDSGSKQKLTRDGVHMNYRGNLMMARGVLRAFGLDAAQMAKAEAYWQTVPEMVPLQVATGVSLRSIELLEKRAGGTDVSGYVKRLLDEAIRKDLEAGAAVP